MAPAPSFLAEVPPFLSVPTAVSGCTVVVVVAVARTKPMAEPRDSRAARAARRTRRRRAALAGRARKRVPVIGRAGRAWMSVLPLRDARGRAKRASRRSWDALAALKDVEWRDPLLRADEEVGIIRPRSRTWGQCTHGLGCSNG